MYKLENDFVKFWIEDGFLFSEFKHPIDLTIKEAIQTVELRHEISNFEKQYWCYDCRNVKSMPKEVRDYADIYGQEWLYASAVILNSHLTMFMFNIFMKLKTPKIPFKAFTTKADALKWLNNLKS